METYPLRHLRLRPGEAHQERVEVPVEGFVLGGQDYVCRPDVVPAALEIQRATGGDVFQVVFTTVVEGPCMRCLDPASVQVDADAREVQGSGSEVPPELRSDYVADGELLLAQWMRDQVVLLLPDQIVCRPACAGLCAVCGRNLNLEPHAHADDTSDPRWAALEGLRLDG